MDDIFISYKREDYETASLLADALVSRGFSVWWDPKLRAGQYFDDVIERIIQNAKCVIVLWSAKSVISRYVKDEAGYALELGKLVPVAIDNTSLPFRFRLIHTIQLQEWEGSTLNSAFKELVKNIEEKIGQPAAFLMDNQEQPVDQEEPVSITRYKSNVKSVDEPPLQRPVPSLTRRRLLLFLAAIPAASIRSSLSYTLSTSETPAANITTSLVTANIKIPLITKVFNYEKSGWVGKAISVTYLKPTIGVDGILRWEINK